jgi:hypothetical protein
MKTTLLMAAIAAGVTLAATAEAREGHGQRMEMPAFEELDANADGGITLEEIAAAGEARANAARPDAKYHRPPCARTCH